MHRKTDFYLAAAALLMAAVLPVLLSRIAYGPESEIEQLVQILGLTPDSSVADVGAGSGEISIAIAARVPHGVVYSTEIDPALLDKIRTNARKAGLRNIIPVMGKEHDTELPSQCCDAIFLREVYHHLTDPAGMDRSLCRALRTGARLAIIDFEPIAGTQPPLGVPTNRGGHGVPKLIVVQELTRAGLEPVKTMDWPKSRGIRHYCILFRKPSSAVIQNAPISLDLTARSALNTSCSNGAELCVEIAITCSWLGGQVQGFQCARHRHPENPGLLHRVNQMHWKPALALDLGNPRRADPGSFLGQTRSRGRSYERSCMGGRTVGPEVAWDLVQTCLAAEYSQAERHLRRLHKIAALEHFSERTS